MARRAKLGATPAANMRAMSPWREMRLHEGTPLRPRTCISTPNIIFVFCVSGNRRAKRFVGGRAFALPNPRFHLIWTGRNSSTPQRVSVPLRFGV
jgi:hypothetical protein